MPVTSSLISDLERAALAAAEAGAALPATADPIFRTEGEHDGLTEVVTAEEAALVDALSQRRPHDSILGASGIDLVGDTEVRWLIGSGGAAAGLVAAAPRRAVSVGAWIDGNPSVGVVIDTVGGHVFTGSMVSPARCNGTRIRVREAEPHGAIVGTGFDRHPEQRARQGRRLASLLPEIADIRRTGSPALDLCAVAAGWTHGFFEGPLGVWDYAAGAAIVRAAGGVVAVVDDGTHDIVVAGSRSLVAWLRDRLVEAR